MLRARARIALTAVGVCAALACATPIGEQSWLLAESEHFEAVSSAGTGATREILQGLERFRATVIGLTGARGARLSIPTYVFVFGDSSTFRRFRPRASVKGFMLAREKANYIAIDAHAGLESLAVAHHEYVHLLLHSSPFEYPPWYHEGFAEFLSTLRFDGERVVVGDIPPWRADWLLYGTPLSLRRVMTATEVRRWSARATAMFYAESWALAHFLHLGHMLDQPARREAMVRYLTLVNEGVAPEQASVDAFGVSLEALEKEFLRFLADGRFASGAIRLAPQHSDRVRTAPLPKAEALYRMGDFALALGGSEMVAEADRLLAQAVRADAGHARALAALGTLRALQGDPGADALIDRALELGIDDPAVYRERADALVAQLALTADSLPDPERRRLVESARRYYRRALELDPDQPAALAGLGSTYCWGDGDLARGIELLEAARQRLPASERVMLDLARLYTRAGQVDRAAAVLRTALRSPHTEATRPGDDALLNELLETTGLGAIVEGGEAHLEAQLELLAPEEGAQVRGLVPLVSLRGYAGLGDVPFHDVVLAIDESNSTLRATGRDVDGDGKVGRNRSRDPDEPRRWTTDFDDSILQSELRAARALLGRLNPETTRVSMLTFSARGRLHAGLGAPEAARAAVDAYDPYVDWLGTSLAQALAHSLREFARSQDPLRRRVRTVLLLSDGEPTVPSTAVGWEQALEAADTLGSYGIRVHAFALGREAVDVSESYIEVAERTGGAFIPVEDPADVVDQLADTRLTGLQSVEIRNPRLDEPARAVRLFADGSFDAYVPLAPGANPIEVIASVEGRGRIELTRTVVFQPPSQPDDEDLRAAERLLEDLRARTLETDLLARRRRPVRERKVTVEVEE